MDDKITFTKSLIELLSTSGGKIVTILFISLIIIGLINKVIFPLFSIELKTKIGTFGGDFWAKRKHKKSQNINFGASEIKDSLLNFSYDIINDAQKHFQELNDKTKEKLADYIKAIQGCYETSLQDDYKGKNKDLLLAADSLKYLKNLMELASFEKDVINKLTDGVKDLINLENENASELERQQKRELIIGEIKTIYLNIFIGRDDPCRDLVDTHTINTIIEEQAKLKVGDILTKLIPEFKVQDKQFDDDLNTTLSAFLSKLEETQNDK
ncbi:MAG: hypothetical protein HUJ68_04225 [Clostridia bacterium]|nr:hypothetical protein [Clostridia bacterium]